MHSIIRPERAGDVLGVPGRFFGVVAADADGRIVNQKWISELRPVEGYGADAVLSVEIRFDDEGKNGRESFSVVGDVRRPPRVHVAGGCLHDDIAAVFPELAPLVRWHLCATDGPMHYEANTVYLAGDRDCHGQRAGERRPVRSHDGSLRWKLVAVNAPGVSISSTPTGDKYRDRETVPLFILEDSAVGNPPPAPVLRWEVEQRTGEGKARELDAARRVAVWPDATDAQLCAEPEVLRAALRARLPALLVEFRADVERAGFMWPVEREAT